MLPVWILNPPTRKKVRRKVAKRRRAKAATKKRRFSAKQLANQRRFAAAARARAKGGRRTTRKRRTATMAKRKRVTRRRTGVMRSVHRKGGGTVGRAAWRASGYRRNPRRRRVTRSRVRHRRNPGFSVRGVMGSSIELLKGTAATLGGMAVGGKVSNMIPIRTASDPTGTADPVINALKGVGIGVLIRTFGGRFLGPKLAEQAAIGAMINPLKNLVVAQIPQAASFFSAYAMPTFPGGRIGSYASYSAVTGDDGLDPGAGMSSYASEVWNS